MMSQIDLTKLESDGVEAIFTRNLYFSMALFYGKATVLA